MQNNCPVSKEISLRPCSGRPCGYILLRDQQSDGLLMTILRVSPGAAAVRALRFVHTKAPAASRAGPLCFRFGDKALHPHFLDFGQVIQDADGVARAVAFLETQQGRAGISGTGEAEPASTDGPFRAVPDGAGKAGLRLVPGTASATRAGTSFPDVGPAQTAVQAAGSYDFWIIDSNLGINH
jgi:hypothetical protein